MCGLNPCMSAVNPPIGRGGGPPELPVVRHGVFRIGRHWFSSSSMWPSPMTSTPVGMVVPARFADGMMMRRISSLRTAYAARSVLE